MAISPLPTPPTRQDPANFASRGDAFLAALPTFQAEANALADDVNAKQVSATNSASAASASAANASASATMAQAAVTAVDAAINMAVVTVTGTSQAATTGNLYVLQAAGLTTVTLPAAPSPGDVVGVKVANGRTDNLIASNGKNIEGLSEDMKLDISSASIKLQYIDSTSQWRLF